MIQTRCAVPGFDVATNLVAVLGNGVQSCEASRSGHRKEFANMEREALGLVGSRN